MTAHPHVAPAEVIFEPAIDTLGCAAFVVAHVLGKLVARAVSGARFGLHLGLRSHGCPWILVDDRYMTETTAVLLDLRRIVRTVHEIVEVGQAAGRERCRRDRRLAVVQRGRAEQAADGISPSATSRCSL